MLIDLPPDKATQLIDMLRRYQFTLTDSPPAWMEDDEVAERADEAHDVDQMIALLSRQTPTA